MNVREQIELGLLVCPKTRRKLTIVEDGRWLQDTETANRYRLINGGTPVLLADDKWAETYASSSAKMIKEYSGQHQSSLLTKLRRLTIHAYRTKASRLAAKSLFDNMADDALCLSIGGGPSREHPQFTNINLGPFPNVDVVADAHCLPYADHGADFVYCEAVFEHLHSPAKAAAEMFRVLKPGGRAFVCTPFLQPYHGYPHHYQNYTLTGHKLLFESVGFRVVESGACVGPTYTLMQMGATFIRNYIPWPLNQILRAGWALLGIFMRPVDAIIAEKENAYVMASTTYVLLESP